MLTRGFQFVAKAYGGLPASAWLLALVTLINRSGTMVLPFVALYVTRDLGYQATFAGLVLGAYGLGALSGTLLGGWLTDRHGGLAVMPWSFAGAGLIFLMLPVLQTRPLLMAGFFVLGMVSEAYRPAASTAMADCCPPEKRRRAYALDRQAINVGMAVAPSLGGFLVTRDYAWLFRVDGATCLVAGLLVFLLPLRKAKAHAGGAETRNLPRTGSSPWRDQAFLAFLLLVLLSAIGFQQIFSTYTLFLKEAYLLPESRIGLLLGLNGLLIICFEMLLIHGVERFSPLRVIGVGSIFFGLGLVILPAGSGLSLAAFSVLLWTIGEMLMASTMTGFVANRAGEGRRGAYMGLFNMSFSLSVIVGPMVGTWFYQYLGPSFLWFFFAGLSVLVAVSYEGMHRILHAGQKPVQTAEASMDRDIP